MGSTGRPQSGQQPFFTWVGVQNDSQGVQYRPSYSLL